MAIHESESSDAKRRKLLYILHYLLEYSDEDTYVSATDIIKHLESAYGIFITRQTVYADIEILRDCGELFNIDIDCEKSKKGFRILARDFDNYDLQLLVDSVQSSKFITQRKAKELTDKLKRLTSHHNRKILDRRAYVENRIKNMHNRAFYAFDIIYPAISSDNKISFRYFYFNVKKEKEHYKKAYIASPYAVLYNDGNYYLLAFESGKLKHFRVDKMDNVSILEKERREGKTEYKALKLSERSTMLFSMFGGKQERVTLRFSNHLTGVVIDRFGNDVVMIPDGHGHFTVSVAVEVSPQFFGWLCGFGKGVKLIAPTLVAEQMKDFVEGIAGTYNNVTKEER